MTHTTNVPPTPRDDDWEVEFDPTYPDKTSEGGAWYGKTDDEIEAIQLEEHKWAEHEEHHRRLDDLEGDDD
ncbi:hypothetical protein LCG56_27520 (plasmid) [Pseudomonas cannabina pv. alisalensis]|uniref:Uncharacterized protein n=1 Tax=Pseudomonas syringae pv. maculicola str. ES4326 TaxID=629265 RepID=A0A8T8CA07_PSEYM|nr:MULTISPECIES: hypothetical protein [Pseudomonas syringae group]QHF00533.1 hypothetical protein PMA4326_028900 [Pseudomonas syringae pv. maculicola str. ES4326]UBZ00513.1 hypothetical protein LCG56_27520 [Pseudomonas cannabina pv. alisalensis]